MPQSSWGSRAPRAARSPRDNGIISGGRGRLGPELRRRRLLPSIRPSAPKERLRRPETGGRADAGGARVAGPGRPNSISWAAVASVRLRARRDSSSGQLLFVREDHAYGCGSSPFGAHPTHTHFWHLRLAPHPPQLLPREGRRPWTPQESWETVVAFELPVAVFRVCVRGKGVFLFCVLFCVI